MDDTTARQRANEYLAGMAARGFVPDPATIQRYREEIAREEGQGPPPQPKGNPS